MELIMCALVVGLMAPAALAQYNEVYQAGQTKIRAAKYPEARQDYEQARRPEAGLRPLTHLNRCL